MNISEQLLPPKPEPNQILDALAGNDPEARDRMLALLEAYPEAPVAALPQALGVVEYYVFSVDSLEAEFEMNRILYQMGDRFEDDTITWGIWIVFGWLDEWLPGLGAQRDYEAMLERVDAGEVL